MIVTHSLRDYDAEKSAGRMAVQAAAGALMSVSGHSCEDIVMCSTSREWDDMLEVRTLFTSFCVWHFAPSVCSRLGDSIIDILKRTRHLTQGKLSMMSTKLSDKRLWSLLKRHSQVSNF